MRDPISVSDIRFVPAPAHLRAGGLRGWVGLDLDGQIRLESLAVRRTLEGRYVLSFPARRDGAGVERAYVRPLDDATRIVIETAVLDALRERGFIS